MLHSTNTSFRSCGVGIGSTIKIKSNFSSSETIVHPFTALRSLLIVLDWKIRKWWTISELILLDVSL